MTWLSWRQVRLQTAFSAVIVLALAVPLLASWHGLARSYAARPATFLTALRADDLRTALYYAGFGAVLLAPPLIGAFWGAPMVARELETGTHRVAWSQTISRVHWLAVRLGVAAVATAAVTGTLTLAVSWWCRPVDRAMARGFTADGPFHTPRMAATIFDARGVVPIGYSLFALALGVVLGMAVRRTVPAMALTLAVFLAVQIAVPAFVRPHLIPPRQFVTTITADNLNGLLIGTGNIVTDIRVTVDSPGAWIIANRTVNSAGAVAGDLPSWVAPCAVEPPDAGLPAPSRAQQQAAQQCFERLAAEGYRQQVKYQPADRYWPLQWTELALYLAFAAVLSAACLLWVRRLE